MEKRSPKKVRNTYEVWCTLYLGTLHKREVCTQVKAQENDDQFEQLN